jgi:hypothetical protein
MAANGKISKAVRSNRWHRGRVTIMGMVNSWVGSAAIIDLV